MRAALLLVAFAMHAAPTAAADADKETSAQCVARTKSSAVECFTTQARYTFTLCKMEVELAILSNGREGGANCTLGQGKFDVSDHYKGTLRQFAKSREAQSRSKDFFAFWRAAMAGLDPHEGEMRAVYNARVNRLALDLKERADRLNLER